MTFGSDSPRPGPYRRETFPYFARILDCLSPEHPSRVVTLMGSAQIGKTTLAQVFIGATMDLAPCDMFVVHPTKDNAERWAKGKWSRWRQQSKALKRIFGEVKSRDSHDTLLFQQPRTGRGSLQISGANSPSSLSQITTPRIVEDDLSKWEPNSAGDPERQADSRASAFEWAKILKLSTPLYADTCRITRAFKSGTQERWHVPCPHCGHFQPLTWENFLSNLDPDKPEEACFSCVACGSEIEHRHKAAIIAGGKWVAENPSAREPSFHVWRAYSPTRDWASIAHQWLEAEGSHLSEQVFFNDVLGLAYERASEAPPWEMIRERAEDDGHDRGTIPPGGLVLTAGCDCQGDRVEVHVKAFGPEMRRWTVDYLIIPFPIWEGDCRRQLDGLLKANWPDAFGNQRSLDMLAIDGGAYNRTVHDWAKQHSWRKVIVVRGAKSDQAPPLTVTQTERRPDGKAHRASRRAYNVGVSSLKVALYEQLKKSDPLSRGFCGYPKGLSQEFYTQLTSEIRVTERDQRGYPRSIWKLPRGLRNEVLDTEIYAEAAAIRCGWYSMTAQQWDQLRAEREKPNEDPQGEMFDPDLSRAGAAHASAPKENVSPSNVVKSKWMNR
ncbi:Phage terminase large subunit (GpA) [Methyloligella halotolerans]|uniref:Phage terminase large subunit (GpA) n=1 Tax=Methyloligella halotolerans TaxID=1177755 RepID=A0A1E2RY85_9HYPH|nr:Phage terminase large subunit (GpA) [Methyloligella halotolerans]